MQGCFWSAGSDFSATPGRYTDPTAEHITAKANPLQEQILKAGLVKKSRVADVACQKNRARHAQTPPEGDEVPLEADRASVKKAERDRALEAEGKVEARIAKFRGQARQIIKDKKQGPLSEYRFNADGAIRTLLINEDLRN